MLESIRGYLYGLLADVLEENDTRSEEEQAADYIEYVQQQTAMIELRALEMGRTDLNDQFRQIERKLEEASRLVESNPRMAGSKANQQYALLEEIKKMLNKGGAQHLDLRGLVEKRDQ